MSGRGRGRGGGQMGRGRPMSTRQSQRGAESEQCTVSIEGLSSSTTDVQLQNLLRSIGPIEVGTAACYLHVHFYCIELPFFSLNMLVKHAICMKSIKIMMKT